MTNLKGCTILITGGSRGIGAATAKLFAEAGANVAINYWARADKAYDGSIDQVLDEIHSKGGIAKAYNADIRNPAHIESMVSEVVSEFGAISHLVLNAFISFTPKPILDYQWSEFEKKVNADIKSFFLLSKAVLPQMIKNNHGVVIGVSSGMSRHPSPNFSPYAVAKSALNSFVRSISVEYGRYGVRANIVAPGFTETEANRGVSPHDRDAISAVTPLSRLAQSEDIAQAILLLASDYSKFVSGAYLPVDGGLTML